ncbi:MAG: hypothetical protein NTZ92_06065 [Candidatus Omnitrophica bacterium]|nr:hypothetical protein [Candidatus Omnitrophota bacterium]
MDAFVSLLIQEIIRDVLVRKFGMDSTMAGLVSSIVTPYISGLVAKLAGMASSAEESESSGEAASKEASGSDKEAASKEASESSGEVFSKEASGSSGETASKEASGSDKEAASKEASGSGTVMSSSSRLMIVRKGGSGGLGSILARKIDKVIDPKGKLREATSFGGKIARGTADLAKGGDVKVTGKELKSGIELSDRAIASEKNNREKLSDKLASQQKSGDSKGAANTEKEMKAVDAKIAQYEAFKSTLQGYYAKINNNEDATVTVRSVIAGVVKSVDSIGSEKRINKAVIGVARIVGGDKEADYAKGKVDSAALGRSLKRGVAGSVGYKGNIDNEPALQKAVNQDAQNRQDAQKYGIKYDPNNQAGFQKALEKAKAANPAGVQSTSAPGKAVQDSLGAGASQKDKKSQDVPSSKPLGFGEFNLTMSPEDTWSHMSAADVNGLSPEERGKAIAHRTKIAEEKQAETKLVQDSWSKFEQSDGAASLDALVNLKEHNRYSRVEGAEDKIKNYNPERFFKEQYEQDSEALADIKVLGKLAEMGNTQAEELLKKIDPKQISAPSLKTMEALAGYRNPLAVAMFYRGELGSAEESAFRSYLYGNYGGPSNSENRKELIQDLRQNPQTEEIGDLLAQTESQGITQPFTFSLPDLQKIVESSENIGDEDTRPWALIIAPQRDDNKAFMEVPGAPGKATISELIDNGYRIKYVEAGGGDTTPGEEIPKIIKDFSQEPASQGQKPAVVDIRGHGSTDGRSMTFGDKPDWGNGVPDLSNSFSAYDADKNAEDLSPYIGTNTIILVESCSSGKCSTNQVPTKNVAQLIRQYFPSRGTIYAPTEPTPGTTPKFDSISHQVTDVGFPNSGTYTNFPTAVGTDNK